jgi:hypothetical protein
MFWIPEYPKYLFIAKMDNVATSRHDAQVILEWLRGKTEVQNELYELQEEIEKRKNLEKISIQDYVWKDFVLRQQFWLGVLLHFG